MIHVEFSRRTMINDDSFKHMSYALYLMIDNVLIGELYGNIHHFQINGGLIMSLQSSSSDDEPEDDFIIQRGSLVKMFNIC